MEIPFCGSTYSGRSVNVDASRCVNFYPELTGTQDNKSQMILVGTPGTSMFSLGNSDSEVLAITTFNDKIYIIVYTAAQNVDFYSIDAYGVRTFIATITTSLISPISVGFSNNGLASAGVGGDQLAILCDSLYIYNVTTPATPPVLVFAGAQSVEYLDGYFIVSNGTMSHFVSNLYDGTVWGGLATSPVSATPDPIRSIVNHRQQLFFIKDYSTEVWANDGTPTTVGSPFSRVGGAVYDYGIAAPLSVAKGGNSFYFLCTQRMGNGGEIIGVAEITEYSPVIISTPAINMRIMGGVTQTGYAPGLTTLDKCFGYCYSETGHVFYVLTNPVDNWTLVYDATTKMWHERSSFMSDTFTVPRHLSSGYTYFNKKHIVGDFRSSNLYEMSTGFVSDNGSPIYSFRTAQTIHDPKNRNRIFINKLTIDAETGVGSSTPSKTSHYYKAGWSALTTTSKGAYSAITAYSIADIVTYGGNTYYCTQAGTGHQPDTSPLFWQLSSIFDVLIKADGSITGGSILNNSPDPQVYLSWSNDAGHTWSAEYPKAIGFDNTFSTRLIWWKLGMARDRVFKITIKDIVKKIIIGATIEASV